ncbi:MAG: hypothetical protein JWM80_6064, partial [Cyanobacteria bacterium RYN_339]|nr:hypothetical protein [Cyanobacteria bacterium RYN_339]
VGPTTPEEAVLCRLFAEVLGLDEVGIHESFFELGGHSLLAIQLVTRIREQLQGDLPLARLFEAPTVAGLARGLRAKKPDAAAQIRKAPAGRPQRLSYSQEMWWTLFPHREQLEHGIQNSFAAIRLEGALDASLLERGLRTIIARHEALRTTFTGFGKRPLRVVHPEMPFQLDRHQAASEPAALRLLQDAAQAPFDLATGPLIRAAVYSLGGDRHVFMVAVSHLVFDGASLKLLLDELHRCYTAYAAGTEPGLPALPIQYSDYVHWHRRWVQRTVIRQQLWYWLLKGRDMPVVLDLPTDKPRPQTLTMAGSSVVFELPATMTQALGALAQREGVTMYMLLLAAFQVLLHRYSGQADIFVGTPVTNRSWRETEGTIGLFLNFVVLRGNLAGAPRFTDFLQQVKATCLGAYAHKDLPFPILLKCFKLYQALTTFKTFKTEKTMRSNVMFNLLEDFGLCVALGPLQGRLVPLQTEYASQTLHLILTRGDEGLTGHMIFSTDLFHRETIEGLTLQYRALLESVLADPAQLVTA